MTVKSRYVYKVIGSFLRIGSCLWVDRYIYKGQLNVFILVLSGSFSRFSKPFAKRSCRSHTYIFESSKWFRFPLDYIVGTLHILKKRLDTE